MMRVHLRRVCHRQTSTIRLFLGYDETRDRSETFVATFVSILRELDKVTLAICSPL
jgi:hypothetical protein